MGGILFALSIPMRKITCVQIRETWWPLFLFDEKIRIFLHNQIILLITTCGKFLNTTGLLNFFTLAIIVLAGGGFTPEYF